MDEHVHDCIVVGAGPAGSAAALEMARAGPDVVMLERGDRPGQKNVMSGVLYTQKLAELVPDYRQRAPLQRCITGGYANHILGDDWILELPRLRDYSLLEQPTALFTVFRSEFDSWFAQEAESAGVELFNATLVEDLLWEDDRVAGVHTRRGDLRARVVIGADGVNSVVSEKAGLMPRFQTDELVLIARQVLDLPAEVIEERLNVRPGEGALSMYYGRVRGPTGETGVYAGEIYSNHDSFSMGMDVRLDELVRVGLPVYEALEQWERHPHIARLIEGATLREYQAHLIPFGGPPWNACTATACCWPATPGSSTPLLASARGRPWPAGLPPPGPCGTPWRTRTMPPRPSQATSVSWPRKGWWRSWPRRGGIGCRSTICSTKWRPRRKRPTGSRAGTWKTRMTRRRSTSSLSGSTFTRVSLVQPPPRRLDRCWTKPRRWRCVIGGACKKHKNTMRDGNHGLDA